MLLQRPKQNTAKTASVPAPIGGWNARDSLANMSPTDAVQLVNWFPTPTDVTMRKGYTVSSILTTSTGVKTISSITFVDTVATLTTATAHGLTTGAYVSISGTTPAAYSGVFKITVTSTTTFTYTMVSVPANNATVVGSYLNQATTPVNTLMNYTLNPSYKLFGAAGTDIWETKANPAVKVFSGITSDKLQSVNITNTAGKFLVACNGVDPVMIYDGTAWFYVATTTTAVTISSIARTSPSATATVTTATAHGLVTNNRVTISGASESTFNGTFVITVTGANTFTYTSTGTSTVTSVTGAYTTIGITGADSSTFINVNLFKNRLYFTQKDTLNCYYLPVDSIGGAASPLYFGGIARNGGYLQAMGTWTLDAGQGADDYAVFVTSMGEIIVYNGTDPSSATTWALKGVWQLGQTFSRRCFFKWSGDLLLLTQDGLVPLASALQSSRLDPRVNLTDKIFFAVSQAASLYYDQFGWQINYFAGENMLILNIPIPNGVEQYVMHTITKSWARFTNIQGYCWEVSGDADMHFGSNGYVGIFYSATADDEGNITATAQQAYSYFDTPGQLKRFTMVRPILQSTGGVPSVLCGISVDFDTQSQLGAVSFNPTTQTEGVWDTAKWDNNVWAGGLITTKIWQGVTGIGYTGSVNLNAASRNIELHWASTDYVMEAGGVV
tara:strand:+ start:624 stop:2633 length:2010 start_codon:yes stop_codon:yes gene_type:complete